MKTEIFFMEDNLRYNTELDILEVMEDLLVRFG
jgi:hypothetical protein